MTLIELSRACSICDTILCLPADICVFFFSLPSWTLANKKPPSSLFFFFPLLFTSSSFTPLTKR